MESLVSVIVPVFNVENYLDRCVDSIVKQNYKELEIILVNDGSTDHSGLMCDQWKEKDPRITVVHQVNRGMGMARNAGLSIANGEFLMFVDSDDFLTYHAVDIMVKRIIDDNSQIVFGKHADIDDSGSMNGSFCNGYKDVIVTPEELLAKKTITGGYAVSAWAKLYRRDIFSSIQYNELTCAEDLWVFPLLMDVCDRISIVNEVVYYYYQRNNSIMHELSEQRRIDSLKAMLHMVRYLFDKELFLCISEWLTKTYNRMYELECPREGLIMYNKEFSLTERIKLLRYCSIKTSVKWLCCKCALLRKIIKKVRSNSRKEIATWYQ